MKKYLILLIVLLMTVVAPAMAAQAETAPVCLDYTTIIDGDRLYYSGSVDGGDVGIFVMNGDGSDPVKLSSATADLMALSGDNLLVYLYDLETGDTQMAVLLPDGSFNPLDGVYASIALAADGRFYWGMGSCAEDGSDIQYYFTGDAVNWYDYYPLAVEDGYYYYLDCSETSGQVFYEGTAYPLGAALCRMKLADQTHEVISGAGTSFLGVEDGKIYYTRDNFWAMNEDFSDSQEVAVDQGLFVADSAGLTEKRLASYPENENIVTSYSLVQDGVVYGLHSDYSGDEYGEYSIVRIQSDGTAMDSIPISVDAWISLHAVKDDTLYIAQSIVSAGEDDYIQEDSVSAVSLTDGSITPLNPNTIDMLFYTEGDPAIVIAGDRIYYSVYDMERWSVCLKCMNLDGSDIRLLAYGISAAEG